MKKIFVSALAMMLTMFLVTGVQAQADKNYFLGKWDVLVSNLPQGDVTMKFHITDSAGVMKAILVDSAAKTTIPVDKIEQKDNNIILYFRAAGYDLDLNLTKKDDDHASGRLMNMFDAVATRRKD